MNFETIESINSIIFMQLKSYPQNKTKFQISKIKVEFTYPNK